MEEFSSLFGGMLRDETLRYRPSFSLKRQEYQRLVKLELESFRVTGRCSASNPGGRWTGAFVIRRSTAPISS